MSTTTPNPEKESWYEIRKKLKAKFSNLTDADLQYEEGKRDRMFNRLQMKLNKTREELAIIFAEL